MSATGSADVISFVGTQNKAYAKLKSTDWINWDAAAVLFDATGGTNNFTTASTPGLRVYRVILCAPWTGGSILDPNTRILTGGDSDPVKDIGVIDTDNGFLLGGLPDGEKALRLQ